MPLQATSGAASYDAFGGGVAAVPNYIEDVFSTYLYTGNASTQTITNGIDLAGEGGLVWLKRRSGAEDHFLFDSGQTAVTYALRSNKADASSNRVNDVTAFNSDGFSIGAGDEVNNSGGTYVSWTFRKQPKFFDVVTYTGNGFSQIIPHSLGSTPGCVIVKKTSGTSDWFVCFRRDSTTYFQGLGLNSTSAANTEYPSVDNFTPTNFDTGVFLRPSGSTGDVSPNEDGATYVAYLFAHNAGGFGLTGTDNVISCGSFTTDGSGNATVNLGYEPQWILYKQSNAETQWALLDNMRGWNMTRYQDRSLYANTSGAEADGGWGNPTSTGFFIEDQNANAPIIYIAIRRGPMKVPTDGTSVFAPIARTGTGANATVTSGFVTDLAIVDNRAGGNGGIVGDRLRGNPFLQTAYTSAEASSTAVFQSNAWDVQNGFKLGSAGSVNASANSYANWVFSRAPGFFDAVCYTGDSVQNRAIQHNLTVTPELMILKRRTGGNGEWPVYHKDIPSASPVNVLFLNDTLSYAQYGGFYSNPTDTNFYVYNNDLGNLSGSTYVNYLFASAPGVSKVGGYTGTGTTQVINCGFTGGARFVMIKRADSTGDWYVWDSARGIVAGNDPYLLLNSTAAEVTNTDYVDTAATGFEISSTAPAAINASGGTFIFLAIA
jgi:hypothetical protein